MATMAENVIAAGAKTRPPMLEKGMHDSWKTRIWLYIEGKENGEMLIDSIVNGPYQLKKEITIPGVNGVADEKSTVQDGRVTIQNIQGPQYQGYGVNSGKSPAIGTRVTNTLHTTSNFKADHVDAYDSDCDDEATACAIFMASLSPTGSINGDTGGPSYDSELLSELEYNDHVVFNDNPCDELTSNSNVISYVDYMVTIENDAAQYVPPPEQGKNAMILSVIEHMKGQVEQCNTESSLKQDKYIEEIVDLEKAKKKLENVVYKVGQTTQTMHMLTKPQIFYDNTHKTAWGYQNSLYLTQAQQKQLVLYNAKVLIEKHDPIYVHDSEDTLITAKESRLKIQEKHNDIPVDYSKLNKLYEYFVPQKQLSAEQVYWAPVSKPLPSVSIEKPTPTQVFPKKLSTTSMVKENLQKAKDQLDQFDACITK
ncbi:hypothetical protein Tco_0183255 [Tanacetum coccineum]